MESRDKTDGKDRQRVRVNKDLQCPEDTISVSVGCMMWSQSYPGT